MFEVTSEQKKKKSDVIKFKNVMSVGIFVLEFI